LTTSAGTGSEGFWNQDGSLQDFKVKALARSYMPLTQGTLTSMKFDTETADFNVNFNYSATAAESVAYLNQEYWYINEPSVQLFANGESVDTAALGATYDNGYFTFDLSNNSTVKDGDQITLVVRKV